MSLKAKIMQDIKSAMKAKQQDRLTALRFLHSALKNREIEIRPSELSDQDVMAVIQKMAKQHRDSIAQFERAGRQDLVDKEKFELDILATYLPEPMSEEQLKAVVKEAIADLGATSMKDMGRVMQEVVQRSKGAADNKLVSQLVRSNLQ